VTLLVSARKAKSLDSRQKHAGMTVRTKKTALKQAFILSSRISDIMPAPPRRGALHFRDAKSGSAGFRVPSTETAPSKSLEISQ
jgi:hypothetical protein